MNGRIDNGQPDETEDGPKLRHSHVPPNVHNTRLEDAAERLVAKLKTIPFTSPDATVLEELCDEVTSAITLAQSAVMPVPALLEVTGNVEERELAARYMEQKMGGALFHAERSVGLRDQFKHLAETFRVCASDFRTGLHLPEFEIAGRVIPYNESNDTGIKHETALRTFFADVHERNVKAGWWTDIETGQPKKRNLGELLVLFVTEMAEAYEAWLDGAADDKLPQFPGFAVEMADLGIRWADLCGAALAGSILEPTPHAANPGDMMFHEIIEIAKRYESIRKTPEAVGEPETADFLPAMDVAMMIDSKLAFNATRPDHKIENRLKDDGKRT